MAPKIAHNAQAVVEAIEHQDRKTVRAILEKNPRLVNGSGNRGERPLLVAAQLLDMGMMTLLLDEFHADVHVKDKNGYNVYEYAAFGLTDIAAKKQFTNEIHTRYCKILNMLHEKYDCRQKAGGK